MTPPKFRYRLPPCPLYDVERMESWLQDMALRGLVLDEEGINCGLARFRQGEPQALHYRMVARVKPRRMRDILWSGDRGRWDPPPQEERDLFAQYGWSYVSRCGMFYLYAARDPQPCEPDSDPIVQAMSITTARNLEGASVYNLLLIMVLNFFLYSSDTLFLMMVEGLLPYLFLVYLPLFWMLLMGIWKWRYFDRLRRRLKKGRALDHQKPWRSLAGLHHGKTAAGVLVWLAFAGIMIGFFADVIPLPPSVHYELAEYPEDPPFATLADLAPPGEYRENHHQFISGVTVQGTWTVPVTIRWNEKASVTTPDGEVFLAALSVQYHETAAPFLARGLAGELLREEKRVSGKFWKPLHTLPLPPLEADYARAYVDPWKNPAVVLQKGKVVLQASLDQIGAKQLPLEVWVTALYQSIV